VQLRKSLFVTFLSTNFTTVVGFGVIVVLSRLLTPAEVGIFSITVVFVNIAAVFRDFGVSSYLRQEKDLTRETKRSGLGLLITTGWSLALLLYLVSDTLAAFYNQPGIGAVLRVLSISFALVPFASYFHSLLARDLQAGTQAMVNIVGTVVHASTCIGLALHGHSYMSLAWANVANLIFSIAAYLYLRPDHIPLLPSFRGWRRLMRFGSGAMVGDLAMMANVALPDLMLGKLAGPYQVGLYSRANGLVGVLSQIISPTISYNALPYIARNHHANVPLGPMLAKSASYLTVLAWPVYAVIAVFAEEVIRLLYGATWVEAAPLVLVICIHSAVRVGYALTSPALMAVGRPYLSALVSGSSLLVRVVLVLLLGADDLMTFAIAICIADIVTFPVAIVLLARYLGFTLRLAAAAHAQSLVAGGACLALAMLLHLLMPFEWPLFLRLLLVGLAEGLLWTACVIGLRHPVTEELPVLLKNILPAQMARRVTQMIERRHP